MSATSGAYGARLGAVVEVAGPPTLKVSLGPGAPLVVMRLTRGRIETTPTGPIACEDAFLVSLQLRTRIPYELWADGRHLCVSNARRGTFTLIDLKQPTLADLRDPFDVLLFYLPRAALDATLTGDTGHRIDGLRIAQGTATDDPVVRSLGMSLLPALHEPARSDRLYCEHVTTALQIHLARTYGEHTPPPPHAAGLLSTSQESRVKELLLTRLDGDVSLGELAAECGLSRSHFARAFKKTIGQSAHRWLLDRRLDRARELLLHSTRPISEISEQLGFADQSHFTRTFARVYGTTPGVFRRAR
jgi:AraC family transcriptional regulator